MVNVRFLALLLLALGSSADQNGSYGYSNNDSNAYTDDAQAEDAENQNDENAEYQNDENSKYQNDDYTNQGNYNGNYEAYTESIIENCDNSIVEANVVNILCDSPYTYSYGNGAHRNSQVCDYGDMATITIYFDVVNDGLSDIDNIYMTMGVYANKVETELLFSAMNVDLNDLVGSTVQEEGTYTFSMRIMFDKVYGDNSQFVPSFEFGFSSQQDEGYNLGGVNINCDYTGNSSPYNEFLYKAGRNSSTRLGAGLSLDYVSNGLILGIALLMATFGFFYFKKPPSNEIEITFDTERGRYIDADSGVLF